MGRYITLDIGAIGDAVQEKPTIHSPNSNYNNLLQSFNSQQFQTKNNAFKYLNGTIKSFPML